MHKNQELQRLFYQSRNLAINDLILQHDEEFKELLNKRRAELGLPNSRQGSEAARIARLREKRSKGGCGQPKHGKHCLCDIVK